MNTNEKTDMTNNSIDETKQKKKQETLDSTIKSLEKAHGKGILMRLGDNTTPLAVDIIPSGSLALDKALGIGGFPRGRVIEIYGPESSGKTTLALHAIAEAQKRGGICAFVDAEHALDTTYARAIGVDVDNLYLSQPSDGEQALDIAEELINSESVDLIVVDSVAALVPRAEIEGNMGDAQMGLQARLMSQAMRKITASMAKANTAVIFINQLRMKIGVFFGNPETTTGGNALKFYASIRLDVRKIEAIKKGDEVIGNRVKTKVVKNKLAPPFKIATFDILYGKGISRDNEIIELATQHNIINKSGSWYSYKGERIGQGQENARQFLSENSNLAAEIENQVKEMINPSPRIEETQEKRIP